MTPYEFPMRPILLSGVTLLLSLTGAFWGATKVFNLVRGEQAVNTAKDWIEVPAIIQSSEMELKRGAGMFCRVIYSYEYQNQVFKNDRDNFFTDWRSSLTADFIARNTKVKGALKAYVNPRAPGESVLKRDYYSASEIRKLKFIYFFLSIGGAVTAVFCIIFSIRS